MADKAANAIIAAKHGREKTARVSVNGMAREFPTDTPVALEDWFKEALETSGYTVTDYTPPKSSAKAEDAAGEGSPVASNLDTEDRTEPHKSPEEETPGVVPAAPPGTTDGDGAPVLVGGDETDPKNHTGATLASEEANKVAAAEDKPAAVKAKTTAKPKPASK